MDEFEKWLDEQVSLSYADIDVRMDVVISDDNELQIQLSEARVEAYEACRKAYREFKNGRPVEPEK